MKSVFIIAIMAVAMIGVMIPSSFAETSEITITTVLNSGFGQGCELTEDGCYSPNTATVDVGGVVIFSNIDSVSHTFAAGNVTDGKTGEFDTSIINSGRTVTWIADVVGEIDYFCTIHPWMTGLLTVQGTNNIAEQEPNIIFGKTIIENMTPSTEFVNDPIIIDGIKSVEMLGAYIKFNIRISDSFDEPITMILKDGKKNIIYTKETFAPTGQIHVNLKLDFDTLDRGETMEFFVIHDDNSQEKKFYTSNFGATIELDKKVYLWTDSAYITITAPEYDLDSELVDEIGNTKDNPVKVSTRHDDLDNYKLVETGKDTGEFWGTVQLTPNNQSGDNIESPVGDPMTTLTATDNDGLTVSFVFSENESVIGSALIRSFVEADERAKHIHGFHIAYDIPEHREVLQILGDKELSGLGEVRAFIEFPDNTIKLEKTQFKEDGSFEILFDLPEKPVVGTYDISISNNSGVIDNITIEVTDKTPFGSKSKTVEETLLVDTPVIETPITPEPIPEPVVEPVPEPEPLGIASFVDKSKDPQSYVERYSHEPQYKEWFDKNYPQYSSIYQAVGLSEPTVEQVVVVEPTPEPVVEPTPEPVVEPTPEPVVEQMVNCGPGTESVNGVCQVIQTTETEEEKGGGCLIATAAYGSELAPQVQMLREIRDNQLMNTESGSAFMTTFNELYYSFSPTIADMERESPVFKEIVKAGLTPMISTLSIMESAETESEVLGLGLSVIALNLGMYIGLPAFGIVKVIQFRKKLVNISKF